MATCNDRGMQGNPRSIANILNASSAYRIPPYQRAYNLFAPYGFILLFMLLWQSRINEWFFTFVYWVAEAIGVSPALSGTGFDLMRFWSDWI